MDGPRKKPKIPKADGARGQWATKTEFILVVAGNVIGLGNVWRFPYFCYRNGGVVFLIPYSLLAVFFGIPLFLLETTLGQFTQEGFITCWRKICPLAQGIGYGHLMVKLASFTNIMVQVWTLFYLVFAFRSELPWATCGNTWNTDNCRDGWDFPSVNQTANESRMSDPASAATQFWERRLLGLSGGVEELGSVRSELALCLLLCWFFCFFSIRKGVLSMGKVAYVTAIFPYVLLVVLFTRAATLPGASEGIYHYLRPQLSRLADLEVWTEAGSEILFSYSLTSGVLIVLGSYNPYNNNCYRDCFWICALISGTSFIAGFLVFCVLGFLAQVYGVSIDMVAEAGPVLAFIAYPQATALMPFPQFWSVCFFLMLILLAAGTHFVCVEALITSASDLFPKLLRSVVKHEIFSFIVCVLFFLIHLILVTQGGNYIFQLIDYYGVTRLCDNFMSICECLAVGWIFGAERLVLIIEDMTGHRPSVFFRLSWKFFIPLFSAVSFLLHLVYFKHLQLDRYVYPHWVSGVGWFMTLSPVLLVLLWIIGHLSLTAGTFRQRLSTLCRPVDHPAWQKGRTKTDRRTTELTSALTT